MEALFLSIKQGGHLALRSLPVKGAHDPLSDLLCFSLSPPRGTSVKIVNEYKEVPFSQEKLKIHKRLIEIYRATISWWEASEPDYPLLHYVKEQLKRELKFWTDVTGGQPCQ